MWINIWVWPEHISESLRCPFLFDMLNTRIYIWELCCIIRMALFLKYQMLILHMEMKTGFIDRLPLKNNLAFLHCTATCMKITAASDQAISRSKPVLVLSLNYHQQTVSSTANRRTSHSPMTCPSDREDMFIALRISSVHVFAHQVIPS